MALFIAASPAGADDVPLFKGIIVQDRVLAPLRAVAKSLGAEVVWSGSEQDMAIQKNGVVITLALNSRKAAAAGKEIKLDVPPTLVGDLTYVPLRFVAEALGAEVSWSSADRTATIVADGKKVRICVPGEASIKQYSHGRARVVEIPWGASVKAMAAFGQDQMGKTEELASLAKRYGAVAAINGAYFNAYADRPGEPHGAPYGTIIKDGKMLQRGYYRAVAGVTADGRLKITVLYDVKTKKDGSIEYIVDENGKKVDWSDVISGVEAGPRLVKDGRVAVEFSIESFGEDKILTQGAQRSAIGVKPDNTILLVTVSGVTIHQLAEIMKELGAQDAMNLDGGASSGLYYSGRYVTRSGRPISNALLFVPAKEILSSVN